MNAPEYSLLVEPAQWAACASDGTDVIAGGGVELARLADTPARSHPGLAPAGLTFDSDGTAYRSRPARHRVEVVAAGTDPPAHGPYRTPVGIAVDARDRLAIADRTERAVYVVDLATRRPIARIPLCAAPIDVAAQCDGVVVLTGTGELVTIDGRRGPLPGPPLIRPCYPPGLSAIRIAVGPLVLWRNDTGECVVAAPDGTVLFATEWASDLDTAPDGIVVTAHDPGRPFTRHAPNAGEWLEIEPVDAPGYDGGAIAVDPGGHIGYTIETGMRWSTDPAARYRRTGTLVTYRMDSRRYRTRWGRAILDACVPRGTDLRVRFATTDDDTLDEPAFDGEPGPVYGRARPDRPAQTYEAPVRAAPGRYLWIELTLTGTERTTPKIFAVRVERPGHNLLDLLPRLFSREERDAGFLYRMLMPAEAMLREIDDAAAGRSTLVDPATTRSDWLPWLAGFAGLTLDRRWPEVAQRELIAEAYTLFRFRGTTRGLTRTLAIYLRFEPKIVEDWQLRGLAGTVLDTPHAGPKTPTIGAQMRETGSLGRFTIGGTILDPSPYRTAAHRFTVLIRGTLDAEQRAVVDAIIDAHRPAHTAYRIRELGQGMRIGTVRIGLTSYVGPRVATRQVQVGAVRIGRDGVVGVPVPGTRVGVGSVVGTVRVG